MHSYLSDLESPLPFESFSLSRTLSNRSTFTSCLFSMTILNRCMSITSIIQIANFCQCMTHKPLFLLSCLRSDCVPNISVTSSGFEPDLERSALGTLSKAKPHKYRYLTIDEQLRLHSYQSLVNCATIYVMY